jgi:hypothetical protein
MPTAVAAAPYRVLDLNAAGHFLLRHVDYGVVVLAILITLGAVSTLSRWRRGRWPTLEELVHAVEACALLWTGAVVAVIFGMTDPPAVEELSHETRAAIAIIVPVLAGHVGMRVLGKLTRRPTRRKRTRSYAGDRKHVVLPRTPSMNVELSNHPPAA